MSSCCYRQFSIGEPVCPICNSQQREYQAELETAREFRVNPSSLKNPVRVLLDRGAVTASDAGTGSRFTANTLTLKNPNRRKFFQLFGIYLPEREAKTLLKKFHDFKGLEAKTGGLETCQQPESEANLTMAARQWANQHLPAYLQKSETAA